jgi:hypothetical protein
VLASLLQLLGYAAGTPQAPAAARPNTYGGGYGHDDRRRGKRRLAGTGNYVALPPRPETKPPDKPVVRKKRRVALSPLDQAIKNQLALLEARERAKRRLAEQAEQVNVQAKRIAEVESIVDRREAQILADDIEIMLLLLLAA